MDDVTQESDSPNQPTSEEVHQFLNRIVEYCEEDELASDMINRGEITEGDRAEFVEFVRDFDGRECFRNKQTYGS